MAQHRMEPPFWEGLPAEGSCVVAHFDWMVMVSADVDECHHHWQHHHCRQEKLLHSLPLVAQHRMEPPLREGLPMAGSCVVAHFDWMAMVSADVAECQHHRRNGADRVPS